MTPVDLGNLRASWFVVTAKGAAVGRGAKRFRGSRAAQISADHTKTLAEAQATIMAMSAGKKKFLMMGYSANYALYVHENFKGNFKRTGSGPRWFESAFKNSQQKIVQIVRDNAKIK